MFRIFASLTSGPLGDFATHALLIASIRELFDDAELCLYFQDNRPYKKAIASCVWNASSQIMNSGNNALLVDYLDPHVKLEIKGPQGSHEDRISPDLVLTTSMFDARMLNGIPLTTLRPPQATAEESCAALVNLGLDPSRWVATVYWKEPGYQFRGYNSQRMITDPTPYFEVMRHIVETLGGQVVRLGHPTETVLPKLPGLVDLGHIAGSEWLQVFAVSISRFMIASASGPSAYGSAFGVPTALTDIVDLTGVWRPHDYMVTQGFVHEGSILRQTDALNAGYLWAPAPGKKQLLVRNTAAELIAATDEMFIISADCAGWRNPWDIAPVTQKPNHIIFPMLLPFRPELLIPPSRRPKEWPIPARAFGPPSAS